MNGLLVPNKFPSFHSPYRIAFISDFPRKDDTHFNRPLQGSDGRFLAALLSRAGASLDACYLGNVCQYQPTNFDGSDISWTGDEVQNGLYQLTEDLKIFKPNICVLLGNIPLKAAKDHVTPHPLVAKAFRYKTGNWRGSLFLCSEGPLANFKCISTYHPAYCLRAYEDSPYLQFDLRKAVRQATSPLLILPKRDLRTNLSPNEQCMALRGIRDRRLPVALDIEGGIDTMSCISFATSPENAFIIPFYNKEGSYVGTADVWRELALTLEDENVPKILQNSLYDRFVLHYSYGIRVRGVTHDTMLKHWELYSELEKSLGVQCSLYTDEPYYKGERKSQDDKTFYEYCCRDSACTLEISDKVNPMLRSPSLEHYRLNMELLNPFLYMELRGMRYDVEGAEKRRIEITRQMHERQAKLNALTGHGFSFTSLSEIQTYARAKFFVKKGDRPYKEYEGNVVELEALLRTPDPNLSTVGAIEDCCETSLNVNAQKQFQAYLYETLKLPVQMSNKRNEAPHPTTDYEALLNLSRWCLQNKHDLGFQVCQAAIELRSLDTRQQMLSISADRDQRIRCGYNVVGTNTGRVTCYESPTGSGYNLTTIPNYTEPANAPGGITGDRDLFLADEDCWYFQCDLAGADGWTVAAYAAMLGDRAMLDDYLAGIKPYARIALKIEGRKEAELNDLQELVAFLKTYKLGPIPKLTAKRVQHGGAYLEGGLTISRNVLKDSEGKHYISPGDADRLKRWYLEERYPGIVRWQRWVGNRLAERPVLTAASGQVRQFFGRADDIITKAVAFEPQANTTYATNLAAHRLWHDPDNRVNSLLRVEPLHQVHDALNGQFPKRDTAWAVGKIRTWFNNQLTIAGQQIVIPFDGHYGKSWGDLNEGEI